MSIIPNTYKCVYCEEKVTWENASQHYLQIHLSPPNNGASVAKPSEELASDGQQETKLSKLLESDMDYINALRAAGALEIRTNSSTIESPSYGSQVSPSLLENTHRDYSVDRRGMQYSVSNATQPRPNERMHNDGSYKQYLKEEGSLAGNYKDNPNLGYVQPEKMSSVATLSGTGTKYDQDKPALAYIPKAALYAEGQAFAYGAKKYDAWNYKHGLSISRTLSASLRHIVQFLGGEDVDVESGVNHLGCARANLAMALDTLENHPSYDDRFKGKK